MHSSGIRVSKTLKTTFKNSKDDSKIGYLEIEPNLEKGEYELIKSYSSGNNDASEFDSMKELLKPKKCSVFLKRMTDSDTIKSGKNWCIVSFIPDRANVKEKMLVASSRKTLRGGLDGSAFINDFFFSTIDECSWEEFKMTRKQHADEFVLTQEEMLKHEAETEAAKSMGESKVSAMANLPTDVTKEAHDALIEFKKNKTTCVMLSLNSATQVVEYNCDGKFSIAQQAKKLTTKEPVYIISKFNYKHDGSNKTKTIFTFYCPENANRKHKMIYASWKRNITQVLDHMEIEVDKTFEIRDVEDFNEKDFINELHPKKEENKTFFKKKLPMRGRRKAGKRRAPTFK